MAETTSILLLSTNQLGARYIRLGDEMREIEDKIQPGPFRDSFEFISRPSMRVSDLGMVLLKHKPQIVHFSGHGKPQEGILLEDDKGKIKTVEASELTDILTILKDNIRLVFLNVCYSKPHAEAIAKVIDYAIGMNGPFNDESAIIFASSFYQALAFGRSVKDAFDLSKKHLEIGEHPGFDAPELLIRPGVDASQPFIDDKETARLEVIFKRLINGTASEDDRLTIHREVLDSNIIIDATEDEAAAEGETKEDFSATISDGQLHVELGSSMYQSLQDRIFPPPPGIAPPLPPFIFIGRENALEDIKRLLASAKGRAGKNKVTVLRGGPGVGKTTLVGVIGRDPDLARMFPDGVLWTSLEQKPNLLLEIARWGQALGTDEIFHARTLKDASAKLADLLRHRRMLLIVDDVWDTAHTIPFIAALGEQCALLVTTRLTRVAEDLANDENSIYNLPVLTVDDALKLLRILAPAIVEQHQDVCRELVSDLEGLPLAIHVVARLLKSEAKLGWEVTNLIRELREEATLISHKVPEDHAENGEIPSVRALLNKSTNMLDESTRDFFAFLGAFAPKPATFDLAAIEAAWEVGDPRPIVHNLVGHGLLEPVGSGRFQMHRILVDHAKSLWPD